MDQEWIEADERITPEAFDGVGTFEQEGVFFVVAKAMEKRDGAFLVADEFFDVSVEFHVALL